METMNDPYLLKIYERLFVAFKDTLVPLYEELPKKLADKILEKRNQWPYVYLFGEQVNEIIFWLAFTSSLESSLGNKIEEAIVRFSKSMEPEPLFPWQIPADLHSFRRKAGGRGLFDIILIDKSQKTVYVLEIKMSGNLDSKNGPANMKRIFEVAQELRDLYFSEQGVVPVFATIIDNDALIKKVENFTKGLPGNVEIWLGANFWQRLLFGLKQNHNMDFMEIVQKAYRDAAAHAFARSKDALRSIRASFLDSQQMLL